ncbi:nucleotide exchange factor GrpE [Streptomyces sp. KL116D]|uniref:nucleotide exchange factor GrpE n=1 Tax=Streptomyces sp. KL116D TaxID=3045152 RepID=UPI003556CE51
MTNVTTPPPPGTVDPGELQKLRLRVEALGRKRKAAEARLDALLAALLPLDDLLVDTAIRSGHLGRSGEDRTGAVAAAVQQQAHAAHQMLRAELARYDVHSMDLAGKAADPMEARVLGVEPHPTAPEGTVLRETVTGFRRGTECLRRADVVLAVPGPEPEPEPDNSVEADSETARAPRNQPRRTTRARRRSALPRKPSKRRR